MTLHTIILRMPANLYRQVEQRARKAHRPVEDELMNVMTAALPTVEDLPADIASDLAQLAYLIDTELLTTSFPNRWGAAPYSITPAWLAGAATSSSAIGSSA